MGIRMATRQRYDGHGVSFRYPSDWTLAEDTAANEVTISLQTPGATFWSLTIFADRPPAEDVLGAVLSAYRDEYPELDVYAVTTTLCQLPAEACDLDFVCLDLVSSAGLRATESATRTYLVIYQGPDPELKIYRPHFELILDSLELDDDDLVPPLGLTDESDDE